MGGWVDRSCRMMGDVQVCKVVQVQAFKVSRVCSQLRTPPLKGRESMWEKGRAGFLSRPTPASQAGARTRSAGPSRWASRPCRRGGVHRCRCEGRPLEHTCTPHRHRTSLGHPPPPHLWYMYTCLSLQGSRAGETTPAALVNGALAVQPGAAPQPGAQQRAQGPPTHSLEARGIQPVLARAQLGGLGGAHAAAGGAERRRRVMDGEAGRHPRVCTQGSRSDNGSSSSSILPS